jgi:lactobin A/cerein 7B family class IIb bacteriocin
MIELTNNELEEVNGGLLMVFLAGVAIGLTVGSRIW